MPRAAQRFIPREPDAIRRETRSLALTCDVNNLCNEPYATYAGKSDRMATTIVDFVTVTFGVSERF